MLYYGTRISENISIRKPQGYMICKDVPIARTGKQDYLADELGLDGDGQKIVHVYRQEDEVFDRACMASFEGLPFTDNHPNDEVSVDNISFLQKGHVQNVRRGDGQHSNELVADIIVTDPMVISEIQNGKREISCGYNFVLDQEGGRYFQRQIRGNHVALVEQGRAGHSVCIKDQKPNYYGRNDSKMARVNTSILARMFASYAKDEDTTPEEIAEAADEIQSITVSTDPDQAAKSLKGNTSAPEGTQVSDEDVEGDKADQIIALLQQLLAQKGGDEEPEELDPNYAPDEDPADLQMPVDPKAMDEDPAMAPLNKLQKEVGTDAKGPAETESEFVDPEKINEEDEDDTEFEDPEEMSEEDEDDLPVENVPTDETYPDDKAAKSGKDGMGCFGKKKATGDAAIRLAIDAIKPYIASLPRNQRRAAADAAVRQLRTRMGRDARPTSNGYAKIARAKRRAGDSATVLSGKALGRKIMSERNCNAKK